MNLNVQFDLHNELVLHNGLSCGGVSQAFINRQQMAPKKRKHRADESEGLAAARSRWAQKLSRPTSETDREAHRLCSELVDRRLDVEQYLTFDDLFGQK